jgi:hypothetical protein
VFVSEENLNLLIIIFIIIIIISQLLLQLTYNCMFYKQIIFLLLRIEKYADNMASPKRCRLFHHAGDALFQA